MEQVPPRSESTIQEQQEKYPNDWPVITPEQERNKLGLPAVPPMPEAPVEKPKRRVRKWVVVGLVGLSLLTVGSAIGGSGKAATPAPAAQAPAAPAAPAAPVTDPAVDGTAVLDLTLNTHPGLVAQFCGGFNRLKGTGWTDDLIYGQLEQGGAFATFERQGLTDRVIFDTISRRC